VKTRTGAIEVVQGKEVRRFKVLKVN